MELRHLRYFVAVAEEENVTRAARRLNVSQPPLTRQIKDLEGELGVALFTRTGKSIHLTDAGRSLLSKAKPLLASVEKMALSVKLAGAKLTGHFTLGYAPSVASGVITRLLRELRRVAPRMKIDLRDLNSPQMIAGVRSGELDAALLVEPPARVLRNLVFERVHEEPLRVAVAAHHPAAKRAFFPREDLFGSILLALDSKTEPETAGFFRHVFGARVRQVRPLETFACLSTFASAVSSGQGVALVAASNTRFVGNEFKLIPLRPEAPPLVLGLLRLQDAHSPFTAKIREILTGNL